jgi:hypothetical protein
MADKEPIEQSCARAANMEVAGRRWRKANANFGAHYNSYLATDYTDFHRMLQRRLCQPPNSLNRRLAQAPLQLFDKDLTGAAANMSILREIHFGNA